MKRIHPHFRKPGNLIGIYLVTIAAIIGFHMLQDNIIPDWLLIVAAVFFSVGLILLPKPGPAPEKQDNNGLPFDFYSLPECVQQTILMIANNMS